MSEISLPLAIKWRPQNLSQVVGHDVVKKVLTNSLNSQKIHQSYLFSGIRGNGKTSLSRILAKCLSCETGISATPCEKCHICKDLSLGKYADLIEVDAASRTKVEETKALLEQLAYAPVVGRFKIYIIDEVHMLSKHSFNALLKTLEEPPAHVKFIFATTNPESLPDTIISRCVHFNLQPLSVLEIAKQINFILDKENYKYESSAVELLAEHAAGSLRDSQSLLEQIIAYTDDFSITKAMVEKVLGLPSLNNIYNLLIAIVEKNSLKMAALLQEILLASNNYQNLLYKMQEILQKVMYQQFNIDATTSSNELIILLAKKLSTEHTQILFDIVGIGIKDLNWVPDPELWLKVICLRMLAFIPGKIVPTTENINNIDVVADIIETPKKELNEALKETVIETPPILVNTNQEPEQEQKQQQHSNKSLQHDWRELLEKINISGPYKQGLKHCIVKNWQEGVIELQAQSAHSALITKNLQKKLQELISQHFNKNYTVKIELVDIELETIAVAEAKQKQIATDKLQHTIRSNEEISAILQDFDAIITNIED